MAQARVEQVAKVLTSDEKLAEHLRTAEEHLIEAVKLFENKKPPKRTLDFMSKLSRVQETVTSLYREELVRIRGPIKVTAVGKRK